MPKLKPNEDIAECKVHSVKALTKLPNFQEASNLLQKLVQSTKALLVRKKWKVLLLTEFYPKNQSLLGLNVNHGYKIMIRLRSAENSNGFLPWESLLGTLVHELVHIEIGAHSFEFYSLVDKLCDEVQEDILHRRNESVVMWTSTGHKLGNTSSSAGVAINRDTLAIAAEKRQQYQTIAGQSAVLGGDTSKQRLLSQRELMLQAVERRNQDSKRCSTGGKENGSIHEMSIEEEEFLILNTQEIVWENDNKEEASLCQPCNNQNNQKNNQNKSNNNTSKGKQTSMMNFLDEEEKETQVISLVESTVLSSSSSSSSSKSISLKRPGTTMTNNKPLLQERHQQASEEIPRKRSLVYDNEERVKKGSKEVATAATAVTVVVVDDEQSKSRSRRRIEIEEEGVWTCRICLEVNRAKKAQPQTTQDTTTTASRICTWCGSSTSYQPSPPLQQSLSLTPVTTTSTTSASTTTACTRGISSSSTSTKAKAKEVPVVVLLSPPPPITNRAPSSSTGTAIGSRVSSAATVGSTGNSKQDTIVDLTHSQ